MNDEDRIIELIEEFWDVELDDGALLRHCAKRCIEFELEERAAVLAALEVANISPQIIDFIARGLHRGASTQSTIILMKAAGR